MIPLTNLFKYWTFQVFSPGTILREKYEAFKALLRHDKRAHELMAELEEIHHDRIKVDFRVIEDKYAEFARSVSGMVEMLSVMRPSQYLSLRDYFKKFDFYIKFMLAPPDYDFAPPFSMGLKDISEKDKDVVGGKAYNLSAIGRDLDIAVPRGFVVTTNAFYYFIEYNNLRRLIDDRLKGLDISSSSSIDSVSKELSEAITSARMPPDIEVAISESFRTVFGSENETLGFAVRSSAVGEDGKASFAGQYRTVLNVSHDGIVDAYKKVIASKYGQQALYYRVNYGLSDLETPMAVLVLEMIEASSSGVIYTRDFEDPETSNIVIHSIWGLGELLVGGDLSPDIIKVKKGEKPEIRERNIGSKQSVMPYSADNSTEIFQLNEQLRGVSSLVDASALKLGEWGSILEKYFGEPQDIEWCGDTKGHLYIVQSRPLRWEDEGGDSIRQEPVVIEEAPIISGGERASGGAGAGKVFKIEQESDLLDFPQGGVLVAKNASPTYVKIMDRLSAVVTDTGSRAGHFSSVAREFGVPALVNMKTATGSLSPGQEVTVDADVRAVYNGIIEPLIEKARSRKNLISDSPFARKLEYIMSFISPLRLVDPLSDIFVPEGVRSLHDILRFCHEKAVEVMFHLGDRKLGRKGGAKKLVSDIPMLFYVLDVGEGISEGAATGNTVRIEDIVSIPMTQVFKGLNHPDIHWSHFTHFDWAEYDRIVMSGGIVSADSAMFASYAVVSKEYFNLNLRFGYHFVIIDSMCGEDASGNYILFRFSGGGADMEKRTLRAMFLKGVLERLGFEVEKKSDLIDGQLNGREKDEMEHILDIIGRLLGATRLMDMYLKDIDMAKDYVDEFMQGRYRFESVQEDAEG